MRFRRSLGGRHSALSLQSRRDRRRGGVARGGAARVRPATGRGPRPHYESDWALRFVSRNREPLGDAYRWLMPDASLVEDLLDKGRFQALAERLELPVPRARIVDSSSRLDPDDLELDFPVIVKPLPYRDERWDRIELSRDDGLPDKPESLRRLSAKVIRADSPQALHALWPRLLASDLEFLVQELVPGAESRIESYHVYVDARGEVAGEFTGRKVRTYPIEFGRSTALTTTDDPDVRELGRALVRRLGLIGVAKLDFKRGPDGQLQLFEVNPRFSLWCHLGAVAGVNLPAMVHADLIGLRRPESTRARPGVRWCRPRADVTAARALGVPIRSWLRWMLTSDINSAVAWDDPMPFLRGRSRSARRAVGVARRPSDHGRCALPDGRSVRLGVLADVHGNLHALKRALAALERESVDAYVCAGDVVGYGPYPNECVELIASRRTTCVAGNHDLIAVGLPVDRWHRRPRPRDA